jgi:hypothetical protein
MKTLLAILLALSIGTSCVLAQYQTNNTNYGTNGTTNPGANTCHIIAGPFLNHSNGHLYYLLSASTWSNSEAFAVAHSAHLATVRNEQENQFIVDTFTHYGGLDRPLWIGLTDRDSEGNFVWTSGEPVNYTKWNTLSGEPNNARGAYEEDFTYIVQQYSGNSTVLATYWNDVPNDGYGVIPPIFGVLESLAVIDPGPDVVPPPRAHVRLDCVQVCFNSQTNGHYQIQFRATFGNTNWFNLGSPITGTGAEICTPDTPNGTNRVYRVSVVQ